jgi:penicillin-binding protein 2
MKYKYWISLALVFLVACTSGAVSTQTAVPSSPTPLPPPDIDTTSAPDPTGVAQAYLDAWQAEDYERMYSMLSPLSQEAISFEDFESLYRNVAADAALQKVDYEILSALTNPAHAQVNYRVNLDSALVGEISRDTLMNLILEGNDWKVQWEETLILPELAEGNYLSMDVRVPSRGNIYDQNGHALVAQTDAVALGLDTSQVDPGQENSLLDTLWSLTGVRPEALRPILDAYREFGWYLPVGEAPADLVQPLDSVLTNFAGMVMRAYRSRFYFDGGVAPQTLGYVSVIQEDEVETYKRRGYRVDEKVGRSGLEAWGEEYLSGQRGGALYVVGPDGNIITKLAETEPQPSYSIFTTLDRDLQVQAEQAMSGFRGAIVVLERDTGRVLAMVSSPGFDPNLFEPTNFNREFLLGDIFNDPDTPLLNRATQGQYPLGSVFKLITMSAALETGLYDLEQTYECGHSFAELPGFLSYDWTYEKELPASGTLTLQEGLMRSCNPFFQHIALALYNQNLRDEITTLAEKFGLGSVTGLEGVPEEEGQIPQPQNEVEAVNQAIGQGPLLVTPLQVAKFIAAIGNGGTLYQPQIIDRIESPAGQVVQEFEPLKAGDLPVSGDTLSAVQEAMRMVVDNPRGTAYRRFLNFQIPVAGKTGTAETGGGRDPHAWFAGYTYAERPDKPDLAVVVLVENVGEGSDYAAPIFKRILEIYYFGNPRTPYWWESAIGVTRTPTPEVTETPTPEGTPES